MGGNFTQAGIFLVRVLISLYTGAFILRFLLQLVRADYYNPVSQALVKVTNPLLKPLRRFIPGFRGIDIAALIVMYLLEVLKIVIVYALLAGLPLTAAGVLLFALRSLFLLFLWIYILSIIVQAIMSWVNPGTYNPVTSVVYSLNEPLLRPVRRVLPPMAGMDFSPLVVIIGLEVIRILIT